MAVDDQICMVLFGLYKSMVIINFGLVAGSMLRKLVKLSIEADFSMLPSSMHAKNSIDVRKVADFQAYLQLTFDRTDLVLPKIEDSGR